MALSFDEFCEQLLGKRKKLEDLTEEEYYAQFARMDPNRLGFSEGEREKIRKFKECPPPFEIIKKAINGEL